jgi:hypothetical protein
VEIAICCGWQSESKILLGVAIVKSASCAIATQRSFPIATHLVAISPEEIWRVLWNDFFGEFFAPILPMASTGCLDKSRKN